MAERHLAKVEVASSNLVARSIVVADFVSFATTFFVKRRLSFAPSLLLPKPKPLRWASVLFLVQKPSCGKLRLPAENLISPTATDDDFTVGGAHDFIQNRFPAPEASPLPGLFLASSTSTVT